MNTNLKILINLYIILTLSLGYIGYKPMQDDQFEVPKRFGIYGKDVTDYDNETDETASIPPKIELHTPVWGNIRKGRQSTRNYGMINYR